MGKSFALKVQRLCAERLHLVIGASRGDVERVTIGQALPAAYRDIDIQRIDFHQAGAPAGAFRRNKVVPDPPKGSRITPFRRLQSRMRSAINATGFVVG